MQALHPESYFTVQMNINAHLIWFRIHAGLAGPTAERCWVFHVESECFCHVSTWEESEAAGDVQARGCWFAGTLDS